MSRIRIKLNRAGVRELLRSEEMAGICRELAEGVAARAGDGYGVNVHTGRNRVNASVSADTYEAKRDSLKNDTLIKALYAGGESE